MIDILLFAGLREAVGQEKITLEAEGMTVAELKASGLSQFKLPNLQSTMVAINEEYALDDYILQQGDVVALIPPVSGG